MAGRLRDYRLWIVDKSGKYTLVLFIFDFFFFFFFSIPVWGNRSMFGAIVDHYINPWTKSNRIDPLNARAQQVGMRLCMMGGFEL